MECERPITTAVVDETLSDCSRSKLLGIDDIPYIAESQTCKEGQSDFFEALTIS